MAAAPLKLIAERLTRPSSKLEPIKVRLECGHLVQTNPWAKRARCELCKRSARIRQVVRRLRAREVRRVITPAVEGIYVSVEKQRLRKQPEGYRAFRLTLQDVTKQEPGGQRLAAEPLRIACDARALGYVRAKLLELAEELDGAVVVT